MNKLNHNTINIFIQNFTNSATIIYHRNNFINDKVVQDPNKNIFRDYIVDISWNTMAWITSEPNHIIHFN